MRTDPNPDQPLVQLPAQPAGVEWPTVEWPEGPLPAGVVLERLMAEAFDPAGPLRDTFAVVIVHRGRLVYERYGSRLPRHPGSGRKGPGREVTPTTPLLSWSVSKSMLHAVVGMLVADGRLVVDDPAPVPTWRGAGDPRGAITLQHLLAMRDGLDFLEAYDEGRASDVLEMLFGAGRSDMAAYAADRPLAAPPGTRFQYSSGTSNVISGVVAREVGPGDHYRRFLSDRLFGPLGMASATPTFDEAGTWAAASFTHATARDYARFGLLYLRDGMWETRQLLPAGWVDHGRRPRSVDPDDGHFFGAHWWSREHRHGWFWASGHDGQFVDIVPGLDLVVVRMGFTGADRAEALAVWRAEVIEAFAGID